MPCQAMVVASCHMLQGGLAGGGLFGKAYQYHHSPRAGAKHPSWGQGRWLWGDAAAAMRSLWARLWVGMGEEGGCR